MKHNDIRVYFIRHVGFDKIIELVKIDSKFNLTNALIKVITCESFKQHRTIMQILHEKHRSILQAFQLSLHIITLSCFGYNLILV